MGFVSNLFYLLTIRMKGKMQKNLIVYYYYYLTEATSAVVGTRGFSFNLVARNFFMD